MKFTACQDYPATVEDLWAAFSHAGYPQQKYRTLGSTAVQILRFNATEKLIEVELERETRVAAEKIPVWARAFVGSEQRLHHHTRWQRTGLTHVDAELDIVPVGLPVGAHATGSVIELAPEQTRMTLTFDVVSWLPGFGAAVERLFAEQVREALQADHDFTLRYLERAIG